MLSTYANLESKHLVRVGVCLLFFLICFAFFFVTFQLCSICHCFMFELGVFFDVIRKFITFFKRLQFLHTLISFAFPEAYFVATCLLLRAQCLCLNCLFHSCGLVLRFAYCACAIDIWYIKFLPYTYQFSVHLVYCSS